MPANFKIIMDSSKIRNSYTFVHSYKIADVDQENILSLVLSPQVLPGKLQIILLQLYMYIISLTYSHLLQLLSNSFLWIIIFYK